MPAGTNCVLITGAPGVGKTSMVKELCENLKKRGVEILGFYTEELRNENQERTGYDIVTFDGKRTPLARKQATRFEQPGCAHMANYTVYVNQFESEALKALDVLPIKPKQLVVVDEIGKMECKSRKFSKAVKILSDTVPILATAPFNTKVSLEPVDHIKTSPHAKVICIHCQDHQDPFEECLKLLEEMLDLHD